MKNAREVESLFSQKAATWNDKYAVNGPLRYRLEAFEKNLRELVAPPARVLDFGCGTGNLAACLSAAGYAVSGCDISARMIEQARGNHSSPPVDWQVLPTDWQQLPFPTSTFDAIVASSAFEYIADLDTTLVECERVLKPGGVLVVTVPNPRKPIRKLEKFLRPLALLAGRIPLVNRLPKVGPYLSYLNCSCNRMSLSEWFSRGRQKRLVAVEPSPGQGGDTALAFLRFRKQVTSTQTQTEKTFK